MKFLPKELKYPDTLRISKFSSWRRTPSSESPNPSDGTTCLLQYTPNTFVQGSVNFGGFCGYLAYRNFDIFQVLLAMAKYI